MSAQVRMDATSISSWAKEIQECETALSWLREYGVKLNSEGRCDDVSVSIFPHLAGSCHGAKQASKVLSSKAKNLLPEIVAAAIQDCENTIAMRKAQILDEASK